MNQRKLSVIIFLVLFLSILITLSCGIQLGSANVTLGSTGAIAPGGYVQRSSSPLQLFGIGATSSGSDTLTSVNIDFSGSGFSTGNLLSLSTDSAASGVGVYRDTGTVDDAYDSSDAPITLATCIWNLNQVQITFSSETVPTAITGNYQWIIVMRTSSSMTNLQTIVATISANQITYSDSAHQPASPVTTATMTALVGPITIQSDGSITPSGDPRITASGSTYTLTMDVTDQIVVQKSGITLDGNNHKLQSPNVGYYNGIYISGYNHVTIQNVEIMYFSLGVYVDGVSSFDVISNNIIRSCSNAVRFTSSSINDCEIKNNIMTDCGYYNAIQINGFGTSTNNLISGNTITSAGGTDAIELNNVIYTTVSNNIINAPSCLQVRSGSDYTTITGNNMQASNYAIWIFANHCTINDNPTITSSGSIGIAFSNTQLNTVSGNTITCGNTPIPANSLTNTEIFSNTLICGQTSISLSSSNGNNIHDNTMMPISATVGPYGMRLGSSNNNNINNNNIIPNPAIAGSHFGIGIEIYSSSNNNQISANTLSKCSGPAFYLYEGAHDNTLNLNSITDSQRGFYINGAPSNNINNNDIVGSTDGGIVIQASTSNTISANKISNGNYGLELLDSSSSNTFTDNKVLNNNYGVWIRASSGNSIYHNDFIGTKTQQISQPSDVQVNTWDNGYPSGGNYWSNYAGIDTKKGAAQTDPGADGFGDTPYDTAYGMVGTNKDNYPFMTVFFNHSWSRHRLHRCNPQS